MRSNPYRIRTAPGDADGSDRPLQAAELGGVGALFWSVSAVQFVYALMHGQTGAFELTLPFLVVVLIPVLLWKG